LILAPFMGFVELTALAALILNREGDAHVYRVTE